MRLLYWKTTGSLAALFLFASVFLLTLTGCGGTGSDVVTDNGPFVSSPGITRVGTPTVGGGQTYLFHTEILFNDPADSANPPAVDILNPSGQSLIGGKQKLQQVLTANGQPNSDPNGWTYQFTLAQTMIVPAVNVAITAQDTSARKGNTPFTAANLKLP